MKNLSLPNLYTGSKINFSGDSANVPPATCMMIEWMSQDPL